MYTGVMTWTIRCVYVTYDKGNVFKINTFDEAKIKGKQKT